MDMIKEKSQALAACLMYFMFHILTSTGIYLIIYFTFYTQFWYLPISYYVWIWYFDKDTPERNGRPVQWFRSLAFFEYARNYFPMKVHCVPGTQLDPKRNYLGCGFPHSFIPMGAILGYVINGVFTNKMFPDHRMHAVTLGFVFNFPLVREFALSVGFTASSSRGLGYLLSAPEGGNLVGLVVGGTSEMYYCDGGQYRINLKNRKGFIKVALKNGSPLIPMFTFGETSIFKLTSSLENKLLRFLVDLPKKLIRLPLVTVYGRGLFQDKFGFIPFKHPINVINGLPIEVKKIENPTQADIDALHQTFVEKLTELFEEYKYKFEKDPENCTLVIN